MIFGLLTAVPMFFMQWNFPRVPFPDFLNGETMPAVTIPPFGWIHVSARDPALADFHRRFQYVADDVLRATPVPRRSIFSDVERFGKMLAPVCSFISAISFGSSPADAMIALLSAGLSIISLFPLPATRRLHGLHDARLFINFLFWNKPPRSATTARCSPCGKAKNSHVVSRRTENGSSSFIAALPSRRSGCSFSSSP